MTDEGGQDTSEQAIERAEKALKELRGEAKSDSEPLDRLAGKVSPARHWALPLLVIAGLFVGQLLAAVLVDEETIGMIFAIGAVTVAVLTATVAVLSYARQSAIPLRDIIKVLNLLLEALKELKKEKGSSTGS